MIKIVRFIKMRKAEWLIILIFALIIRLSYFMLVGISPAGDTSYYVNGAVAISDKGISFFLDPYNLSHFYYWGYPFFLTIVFTLFGNSLNSIIIIQMVLQSLAAVLIYKATEYTFDNKFSGYVAGILYCIFWEIFRWDTYILADSLTCFFIVLSVYFFSKNDYRIYFLNKNTILLILSVASLVLIKPTSVTFVACILIISILRMSRIYKTVLFTSGFIIIIVVAYYALKDSTNDRLSIKGYFNYFISLYKNGVIVRDMPEYDHTYNFNSNNVITISINIVIITIKKIFMYWAIIVSRHSLGHKLINIITFIPVYTLSIYTGIKARTKNYVGVTFLVLLVISYNIFHALTEIDYDWRYRLPVIPALIMLASYGVTQVIQVLKQKIPYLSRLKL